MNRKFFLLTGLFALALSGLTTLAQSTTKAEIAGTVTDQNGEALPGVTVTADSSALQGQRIAVTAEQGNYRFSLLPAGEYSLVFTFTGFKTAEVKNVITKVGERTQINQTMEISNVADTIVVTADTPLTDTSTTDTKATFKAKDLEAIPTLTRSVQDVAKFVPGVTGVRMDSVNGGENGLPNIRAGGQEGNNYVVDGLSSRDSQGFGGGINQNFDSIDSLLIVSDPFSPEYGKTLGGAINVVTKSGGNEFSGEVGYQFRDDSMEAEREAVLNPNTTTGFERNKLWANVGGYFIKDKLWFFLSYNSTEPTNNSAGADPRVLSAASLVNLDGTPVGQDFVVQEYPDGKSTTDTDQIFLKLTYNINENQDLTVSYLDSDFNFVTGSGRPLAYGAGNTQSERIRANYSLISEYGVLEVKAGRQESDALSAGVTDFGIASRYNTTIAQNFGNLSRYDHTLTQRDDYAVKFTGFLDTASMGSHEFSLGVDYEKFITRWSRNNTGYDEVVFQDGFTDGAAYNFAYFVDNSDPNNPLFYVDANGAPIIVPTTLTQSRNAQDNNDVKGHGLFLQDRITLNNWTFMLGIRTDQAEVFDDLGNKIWKWDYADFISPRLSVIYDLNNDEKHVFKFGYGIFKDTATTRIAEFFNARGGNSYRQYNWIGAGDRTVTDAELHNPDNWAFNFEQSPSASPFDTDPAGLKPNDNERFLLEYNWRVTPTLAFTSRYVQGESTGLLEDVQVLDNPGTPAVSPHFYLSNFDDKRRTFESIDLVFNGSVGKLLNYNLGVTLTDVKGTNPGNFENETLNNPGGSGNYVGIFGDGVLSDGSPAVDTYAAFFNGLGGVGLGDQGWYGNLSDSVDTSVNFIGNWSLPLDIDLATTLQYVDGFFYAKKGYQPAYGGYYTFPEGRGSRSTDATYWLDLSLARNFRFANRHNVALRIDAFNVTDEQKAISVVEESTLSFETPFARQNPRALQFGVQYKF